MLVYVPKDYVVLVYEGGELRAVLEHGVGVVATPAPAQVQLQYVYLQPQTEPSDGAEAAVTVH